MNTSGGGSQHQFSCDVRFTNLNVGTMTGKSVELMQLMTRLIVSTKSKRCESS